jgi:hypothetical protein
MIYKLNGNLARFAAQAVGLGLVATMLVGSSLISATQTTQASSHREAPLISRDPSADNTDTYAFISRDRPDSVTLVGS